MSTPHKKRLSLQMSPKKNFGTSLLKFENVEVLKQLRAAKINKVTTRSDDIVENESARAVKREML